MNFPLSVKVSSGKQIGDRTPQRKKLNPRPLSLIVLYFKSRLWETVGDYDGSRGNVNVKDTMKIPFKGSSCWTHRRALGLNRGKF